MITEKRNNIEIQTTSIFQLFYPAINKDNIKVKNQNNIITIRSSLLRPKLLISLLFGSGSVIALFRPETDTYWFPFSLFAFCFLYFLWEDLGAINNLKINLDNQTLSIYHSNPLRYTLLKLIFNYKNNYNTTEIAGFELQEKFHLKAFYRTNYIVLRLSDETTFKVLDVPNSSQAQSITDFLNAIIKIN